MLRCFVAISTGRPYGTCMVTSMTLRASSCAQTVTPRYMGPRPAATGGAWREPFLDHLAAADSRIRGRASQGSARAGEAALPFLRGAIKRDRSNTRVVCSALSVLSGLTIDDHVGREDILALT